MSLRALRTLVAIAQHGSFTRAAEAVHLTQSAVSLHVKALEEEFGTALFDRSKRQPVLTDAGLLVVERAVAILETYDNIASEVGGESELRGRLRLGAIHTALAGVLPAALALLNSQYPHLRVTLNSGMSADLAARLEDGEIDAAVTTEPVKPHPYGLVSTTLYEEKFWLIAPVRAKGVPFDQLLHDEPFVRFDRQAWAGRTIDRELRRLRVSVQTSMELDSQEAIIKMVKSGLGVAVLPLSTPDMEKMTDLVFLPFGEPQCTRRVVLLEREDRPRERLATALAGAIRSCLPSDDL